MRIEKVVVEYFKYDDWTKIAGILGFSDGQNEWWIDYSDVMRAPDIRVYISAEAEQALFLEQIDYIVLTFNQ